MNIIPDNVERVVDVERDLKRNHSQRNTQRNSYGDPSDCARSLSHGSTIVNLTFTLSSNHCLDIENLQRVYICITPELSFSLRFIHSFFGISWVVFNRGFHEKFGFERADNPKEIMQILHFSHTRKDPFQIICVHWSGARDTILSCLESMQAFLLENWHASVRYILIEFEGILFIPPNVLSNSEEERTRLSILQTV